MFIDEIYFLNLPKLARSTEGVPKKIIIFASKNLHYNSNDECLEEIVDSRYIK